MQTAEQLRRRRRAELAEIRAATGPLFWGSVLGLLAIFAVLAWLARPGGISTLQDDAIYLFLARSLRQLGYHDLYRVDTPLHNMYPPGYPAVLAVVGAVVGERVALVQAFGIAAAATALGLVAAALRRLWSSRHALMCLAALALNPHLVGAAGKIGSDAVYLLFSMVALWLLLRAQPSPRLLLAVGAAAIAAALTRSVGVTLLAAVGLFWLLERRIIAALLFAAASAGTVGLWLLWTIASPEHYVGRSYIADAAFRAGNAEGSFALVLLARALRNLPAYFGDFIPNRIGIPPLPGPQVIDLAAAAVVTVALIAGMLALWRRWRPAALYLLAYGALLTVWPWALGRFLNVIIPLLVAAVLLGAGALARRVDPRWAFPAVAAMGLALAAMGGIRSALLIGERNVCDWGARLPPAECRTGSQGAFFDALDYLAHHTPPDAVVLSGKPAPLYYFTGRRTLSYGLALAQEPATLLELLRREGVRYVVLSRLHLSDYFSIAPMLEERCGELALEASFSPSTLVVRVLDAGERAPDTAACQAIAAYLAAGAPRQSPDP